MDVRIEKLVYGGEGLAHHEGHTVFVPFVMPGEVVRVRAVERKKKFIRGRAEAIVEPAAGRAAPPCPHFTDCGGCHYQHMPYEDQLRAKADILRETLRRIGRIEWTGSIQTHASPPFGYRNRAQWKVRPLPQPGGAPRLSLGYFRAASNALCAVEECPVLSPALFAALRSLQRLAGEGALPETLREVEAFVDSDDAGLLLTASLVTFPDSLAALAETLRQAVPGAKSILLHESSRDRFELIGPGHLPCRVGGATYRVGHLSFFQANRFLIEEMVRVVVAGAEGRRGLDLFAGVGLFAAPLLERIEHITAVESNPAAARDLTENLKPQEARARAVNAEVEPFLAELKERPDFVVMDPPRAGVGAKALEHLAAAAPPRVTYVSCDPSTLARDLAVLAASGYRITELHLFDVFPQTYHIESIVQLARDV
jgi:23S rRNA (uracil1939-C5)-methyltransferase